MPKVWIALIWITVRGVFPTESLRLILRKAGMCCLNIRGWRFADEMKFHTVSAAMLSI